MQPLASDLDRAAVTWDERADSEERLPVPQAAALICVASIGLWVTIFGVIVWAV